MGVNSAMYTAITGLDTFGTALGIVSDNIANANTTSYKANTARFGDLVSGYYATQSSDPASQGIGTTLLGVTTNLTTGSSINTGTWSNVMIQGNGYFSVQHGEETLYTRDGTFRIDKEGFLVNIQGDQVNGIEGGAVASIRVETDPENPTHSSYEINRSGQVWGTLVTPDQITGETKELIGTLMVTTFPNPEGLIRNGSNMYYRGADSGNPNNTIAGQDQAGDIISGSIEGSNVDLAEEMVNMIIYQADYTANSKAISTSSNMLDTVVNLIR